MRAIFDACSKVETTKATAGYRAAAVLEDGRKAVDKFRLMFKREKVSTVDVSR